MPKDDKVKKNIETVIKWYQGELRQLEQQKEAIHDLYNKLIDRVRSACEHKNVLGRSYQYENAQWICEDCGKTFDHKPTKDN